MMVRKGQKQIKVVRQRSLARIRQESRVKNTENTRYPVHNSTSLQK